MRIVSLVPAGTEILFALGAGDHVVGVSHECDYPTEARHRPRVSASVIPTGRLSSGEIETAIANRVKAGLPLYEVDVNRLGALDPTIVVTQSLCDVCAPAAQAVRHAVSALRRRPALVSLETRCLADIPASMVALGNATGTRPRAEALVSHWQNRIERIRAAVASEPPRRVVCVEWLDPPYACGHWIPEMVRLAGGIDPAGREGIPSVPTTWDELLRSDVELVVALPCGYSIERSVSELTRLAQRPDWGGRLRECPVSVVDSTYFTRPGPRVIDGIELLASILHPNRIPSPLPIKGAVEWAAA